MQLSRMMCVIVASFAFYLRGLRGYIPLFGSEGLKRKFGG